MRCGVVIFMPAEGTTRLFYNEIASTVASNGYTVVTIDDAYVVDVVQYLDGSLEFLNQTLWNNPDLVALRELALVTIQSLVEDVSFVLDSLSNATLAHSLVPNLPPSGLNTTHTAMFGHSFGGAAAYSVLQVDERVLGGLNMDGGLFGPGLLNVTNKPFMFVANMSRYDVDPYHTWTDGWSSLQGWKRNIIVAETFHYDWSDYPIVFETLGITPEGAVAAGLLVGPMKGTRALQITTTYVSAFLDFVFHGRCSSLLDGHVSEFPEVTFQY
ncbi:hypothetical protein LTR08_008841 [Meristemomyces frigidus]|nr:hypothetical protein LTR08_008841 [Meristemomyces frigidus]